MNYSRPKLQIPQPYSQYCIQNTYFRTHQGQAVISENKTHLHKRKTSQVSTLSCKSKNRNLSFNDKKNHSLAKHSSHNIVFTDKKTQKTTLASEKRSIQRKQFSLQKIRILNKNKNTLSNRKQKLKLDTQRKNKPMTTQNLTSRYIKNESNKRILKNPLKSHKTSQSSFINKYDYIDQKYESDRKKYDNQNRILNKLRIKQKNLELMVSRCSKVMTQYYERITLLKKQNEILKIQNIQLKKYNEIHY